MPTAGGSSSFGHVGFLAAAALCFVLGWTLYEATIETRNAAAEVDQTLEALQDIGRVNEELSRAESAQRGFLISGEQRFIVERDNAFANLARHVAALKLHSTQVSLQGKIRSLEGLIAERLVIMRDNENVRRARGVNAILPRVAAGLGQNASAQIYDLTGQLRSAELQQLERRRRGQQEDYAHAFRILVIGVGVLLLVMVPAYAAFVAEARARRRAESRMSDLAEALPGAVFQYRSFPDGTYRYEFISRSAERTRGIDREAALRDPSVVVDTLLEADRVRAFEILANAQKTLSPVEIDYRVKTREGPVRWFRTSASPRAFPDGSFLWSGHWADVTAKKEMERELVAAKEAADAASRAKSTFLATMSHEIRTPMNGVLGMLELLALGKLDGEQRTTLGIVRESAKSLLRIIDDILDFSKIEAGKMELKPEIASVGSVIDSVWNIYSGNASSKGLVLTRYTDARISPAVLVDPLRLQQILNNFVSNAIKFTHKGEVAIRADFVERRDAEDIVRLAVCDSGIGVSREEMEGLFRPFSQANEATAQIYGGTGLGLSICQRLAALMGGTIEMQSEVGVGTTMSLVIPLPTAEVRARRPGEEPGVDRAAAFVGRRLPPSAAQAQREGTLVLLVDDHPINRMVLLKQVNALGYAGQVAENGLEALDLWSSGAFGAVITDCNMPEMNGYELARHIRACEARNHHARTPLIACTANALGGEAENCFAAGMDDYLSKPVELALLAQALEHWLPLPGFMPPFDEGAARPPASGARGHGSPVIDAATLAEITGGSALLEREILTRFLQYNAEDASLLLNAVEQGDMQDVLRASHRIKGAGKTIGAIRLATVCDRIERASRASDWEAVRTSMAVFRGELEALEAHIRELAPRQPASASRE